MKNELFFSLLPIKTDRLIIRKTSINDINLIMKMDKQEITQMFLGGIKNKTREERNNKKYIRMNNSPIYYGGSIFDDKIVFKTEEQYVSFNNIMYFLEEIYKNGCLENYFQSIKEFFDMSLDLGLLFDAWHETHNKRKALTLYKHRVISKRI